MHDIIVIGGGPAGASAALLAAKAGKKTVVLDNDKGVTKRAWFENFYGIEEIGGPELIAIGKKQAEKFGAGFFNETVVKIESGEDGVTVITEGNQYTAKEVIIATGMLATVANESGIQTKPGTEPRVKTIIDVDAEGKTNVPHVWAAGTVAGESMHGIITAGHGAKVAINAISELNGERYVDHDMLKG